MNDPAKNSFTMRVEIPPTLMVGRTAAHCRNLGIAIPDNIPDCAVIEMVDGIAQFQWFRADFTIEDHGAARPPPAS